MPNVDIKQWQFAGTLARISETSQEGNLPENNLVNASYSFIIFSSVATSPQIMFTNKTPKQRMNK